MIRRNKNNIGRIAITNIPGTPWDKRIVKITGFRGDHDKNIPYVEVMLNGAVFPFAGHLLSIYIIGMPIAKDTKGLSNYDIGESLLTQDE